MKNKKYQYILPIVLFIVMGILFAYLQSTQRYNFFYREQQQIFIYSVDYIWQNINAIGGFSLLIAQFILQFFSLPFVGSFVTVLNVGIITGLLWLIAKRITSDKYLFPLCFIPGLFQLMALIDINYQYQGFVSYQLAVLFLYFYTLIHQRYWQLLGGCIFAVILFFLAGPIVLSFVVSILLFDIFTKTNKSYLTFISVIFIVVVIFVSIRLSWNSNIRTAFLPDAYYTPLVKIPPFQLFTWILLPVVLICFYVISLFKSIMRTRIRVLLCLFFFFIISWAYIHSSIVSTKLSSNMVLEMEHLALDDNWDGILRAYDKFPISNYLIINYVNLALSHKGQLLSRLFEYPQNSPLSLLIKYDRTQRVSQLLSLIQYQMGNIAAAQYAAFEGNTSTISGNCPSMIKMLVKTNLIFGAYSVAEKYIYLLEHTWGYRKWATAQRRFLYNDRAVTLDPELSIKRKDIPRRHNFVMELATSTDQDYIIETNPYDKAAVEYAEAFLLLAKDNEGIKYYVAKYYGTPAMSVLPTLFQEAVISIYENNLNFCIKHGVTKKNIIRYNDFKQKFLQARDQGFDPMCVLEPDYGKTYWYYLMFK